MELGGFAHEWLPLMQRWTNGDFTIMQPTRVDMSGMVVMTAVIMLTTAAQKEQALQGAPGGAEVQGTLDRLNNAIGNTSENIDGAT